MLSNWTVNVFCSVPFWSEIKILSWPENLQNDPFQQCESAVFNSFLTGAAGCATRGPRSVWLSPVGRVQYPATSCSCSCFCTCGGSSLMHWCTWSLDACGPIKINVMIKPVARLSMWLTYFSLNEISGRVLKSGWGGVDPHSVTSDQMWWPWWCSICRIKRAWVSKRRRAHHFLSHRPGMQIGDGELWICSVTLPQGLLKTSRGAAVLNLRPTAR